MKTRSGLIDILTGFLAISAIFSIEAADNFGQVPLAFEPNRGQWSPTAAFGTHGAGFTAEFDKSTVTYWLSSGANAERIVTRWSGARPASALVPENRLSGTVNYYVGRDESRWISGLATYQRLRTELHPGIDVIYYGNRRQLEYDLIVAPGADPRRLSLSFEGGKPRIDAQGNLVVDTLNGAFVQHRPVAYQVTSASTRTEVSANFELGAGGEVHLVIGKYDRRRELVIDPTIVWAKSLGSGLTGATQANGVGVDASGNVFVAGTTVATDFPTVNPFQYVPPPADSYSAHAFLTKFSADGSNMIFSTYFGGTIMEGGNAVAVDAAGNAYLAGIAESPNLPLKNAYQSTLRGATDGFVAKFSPSGALLYSTYLGGRETDSINGIALDSAANMYVTGFTESTDFPTLGAYQTSNRGYRDGFVTKIAASGSSLVYSTFLGGDNEDTPRSIAVGSNGNAYVTGDTMSTNFPLQNAIQSAAGGGSTTGGFLTCLAPSGAALVYSTYVGNAGLGGVDVDSAGAAYVAGKAAPGVTLKDPIQTMTRGGYGGFVAKVAQDGSLVYSTYLAGSVDDEATAIRVDASGRATIVGRTSSADFPTVGAFRSQGASDEAFVTTLSAAGDAILFSSLLGGNAQDVAYALALDAAGNLYVAGRTNSGDFAPPTPSTPFRFLDAAFVAKLGGLGTLVPVTFAANPAGLRVIVDGVSVATPHTFQWAPGVTHSIDVPTPQLLTGTTIGNFVSWSIGGAKAQTVVTPASATTITATLDMATCTYGLSAYTGTVYGGVGGGDLAVVATQGACPWTVQSNVPWIVPDTAAGSGPGGIGYSVSANAAGGTRTGILSIPGSSATLTITQTAFVPTVSYDNPWCCGHSGYSRLFQYTANDLDGRSDLNVSNFLINDALDGRHACYLAFDHVNKILYLVDDAGVSISGMSFNVYGRGTGTLSNSQCTVDGTQSSISSTSGVGESLTIALRFAAGFAGNKVLYFAARDKEGQNSGWQSGGVWNVPASVTTYPQVVSSNVGIGGAPSTVSVSYADSTLSANLSPSQILINDAVDGRHACYVGYDHTNNVLYLVDDSGANLLAGITPGGGGLASQQNSQCVIYSQGTSVQENGAGYTLNVHMAFLAGFKGPKVVYAATQTKSGGNTGWQATNTFTIP